MEPGRFLIPACATDIKPPKPHKGCTVIFKDGQWAEIADHRNGEYYSKKTGELVVVDRLGDDAIKGLTHIPKPEEELGEWKWSNKENKWVEDLKAKEANIAREARGVLSKTDWYVIRKMETGKEIPEDILKAREEARKKLS
jgi:hypothetical protein